MKVLDATRNDLTQAVDRMVQLLGATPEERLTWKPSPSSRSILEIVAHTAHALKNIESQLRGVPYEMPNSTVANEAFLLHDSQFSSRDEVEQYLREAHVVYMEYLDSLDESDLDRSAPLPFGLGQAPLRDYISAGYHHTLGHIAQIEYVQTMYGDHDWHSGF